MQMIGMAETGMTVMGGVDRRCCEKICLNQQSLFLNLQMLYTLWYSCGIFHTNKLQERWKFNLPSICKSSPWSQYNHYLKHSNELNLMKERLSILTLWDWLPSLEKNSEVFRLKSLKILTSPYMKWWCWW